MKSKGLLALVLVAGLIGGACARRDSTTSATPVPPAGNQVAAEPCGDQGGGEMTLYSARKQNLFQPLIDAFEAQGPSKAAKVAVKEGSGTELINTLVEEKANPRADAFIGQDAGGLTRLSDAGVLCAADIPSASKIDFKYRASNGTWTGVSGRARVLIVNTNMLQPSQYPESVFDLTKPEWKGKIAMPSSAEGSLVAWVSAMQIVVGEAKAKELLEGLKKNDVKVLKNHTEVRRAVAAGEVAVGLVNHYYYFVQKKEEPASPVDLVYTDQKPGQIGVLVNVSGIGVVNGGSNPKSAQSFAEFLLSPESQQIYAEANFEYPLVPGVPTAPGVRPLDSIKQMDVRLQDLDVTSALALIDAVGLP